MKYITSNNNMHMTQMEKHALLTDVNNVAFEYNIFYNNFRVRSESNDNDLVE